MTKLSLIIATSFIVQLIYVKNTTPSFTTAVIKPRSISAENQVKRIAENLTAAINGYESVAQRYDAFKTVIDRIGRNCRKVAFQSIIDKANVPFASEIKAQVEEFYNKHVKNTAEQSKQSIYDRLVVEPISQAAAVAIRATCQQMLNIAKNRIKAARITTQQSIKQ